MPLHTRSWKRLLARMAQRARRRSTARAGLASRRPSRSSALALETLEPRQMMASDLVLTAPEDFGTAIWAFAELAPQLTDDQGQLFDVAPGAPMHWNAQVADEALVSVVAEAEVLRLESMPDVHGETTLRLQGSDGYRQGFLDIPLKIEPAPDAPRVVAGDVEQRTFTVIEGQAFSIDIGEWFHEVDGEQLTLDAWPVTHSGAADPVQEMVVVDGRLDVTLDADEFGYSQWAVVATDEAGDIGATNIWVNVLPENDAPRGSTSHLTLKSWRSDSEAVSGNVRTLRLPGLFQDPERRGELAFEVLDVDNAAAFRDPPTVDAFGALRLAPAHDLQGDEFATIRLRVTDVDGGEIIDLLEVTVTPEDQYRQAIYHPVPGSYCRVPLATNAEESPDEAAEAESLGDTDVGPWAEAPGDAATGDDLNTGADNNADISIGDDPVAPIDEDPVAPIDDGPVAPIDEDPVAPIDEDPVAPIDDGPVAPIDDGPVAPIDEDPVAPIDEDPVAPINEDPVAPIDEDPVAPIDDDPVAPIDADPELPLDDSPVAPVGSDPYLDVDLDAPLPGELVPCGEVEETFTWETQFRWRTDPTAELIPLDLSPNAHYSEIVAHKARRSDLVASGWLGEDGLPDRSPLRDEAANEPPFTYYETEPRVQDPAVRRTDLQYHLEFANFRTISFVVHNESNRLMPRDLVGDLVLSFPDNIRVWRTGENGVPVPVTSGESLSQEWRAIGAGQYATAEFLKSIGVVPEEGDLHFMLDGFAQATHTVTFFVEGLELGSGEIQAHFHAAASPWLDPQAVYEATHSAAYHVGELDLDGDTDNDGTLQRNAAEDAVEAVSDFPGLRILTTQVDRDGDLIDDALDGFDANVLPGDRDDVVEVASSQFAELVLEVPEWMPLEDAAFRFTYPGLEGTEGLPPIRLWTLDQLQERSANGVASEQPGHLIPSATVTAYGTSVIRHDQLFAATGGDPRQLRLYVEGVLPGAYDLTVEMTSRVHDGLQVAIAGSVADTIRVHVESAVTLEAVDGLAQEGGEDEALLRVSRGTGNEFGDLPVFFQASFFPSRSGDDDEQGSRADSGGLGVASFADLQWTRLRGVTGRDEALSLTIDPNTGYGVVVIPHGASDVFVRIRGVDDREVEWDETVDVRLVTWAEMAAAHGLLETAPGDGRPGDPLPYRLGEVASARIILLDNDRAAIVGSSNRQPAGLPSSGVADAELAVAPRSPHGDVALRTGQLLLTPSWGGLVYRDDLNKQPLIEVELSLPWSEALMSPDSRLVATATVAGVRGVAQSFDLTSLRDRLADPRHRHDALRLVVPAPESLASQLPTGHYDVDVELTLSVNEQSWSRTVRGGMEWSNRLNPTFGETELGQGWAVSPAGQLYLQDNFYPTARMGDGDFTGAIASRLATLGAAPQSGAFISRGDGTAAWFAATPNVLYDESNATRTGDWEARAGQAPVSMGGPNGVAESVTWSWNHVTDIGQVFVSWSPAAELASNAYYEVSGAKPFGGLQTTTRFVVDQRVAPAIEIRGERWHSLGFFETDGDEPLVVKLSTQGPDGAFSDGKVSAGEVRVASDWRFQSPDGAMGELKREHTTDGVKFVWSDGRGDVTEFSVGGIMLEQRDRNQNRTQFNYEDADGDGRRDDLVRVVRQGGLATSYRYEAGVLSAVVDEAGRRYVPSMSEGRLTNMALPTSAGDPAHWQFGYDGAGQLVEVRDPLQSLSRFDRSDVSGAVIAVVDPLGTRWSVQPQLLDGAAIAGTGELRLAARGRLEPDARQTAVGGEEDATPTSDALREPWATVALAAVNELQQSLTQTWMFQTDAFGLLTANAKPATETFARSTWHWRRNQHGQLLAVEAPAGGGGTNPLAPQRTTYRYERNQLVEVVYPDGGREAWGGYDSLGMPGWHVDVTGVRTAWLRDLHGNVLAETSTADGQTRVVRSSYTPPPESIEALAGGLLTHEATGDGEQMRATDWQYYAIGPSIGLVQYETQGSGTAAAKATAYEYNAARELVTTTRGSDGLSWQWRYDDQGRRVEQSIVPSGEADQGIATVAWVYDALGRLVQERAADGATHVMSYDSLGRLLWDHGWASPDGQSLQFPVRYIYDVLGNVVMEVEHRDGDSQSVSSYDRVVQRTYDSRNQLLSERANPVQHPSGVERGGAMSTYTYDNWGNVQRLSEGLGIEILRETTYEYDVMGRPVTTVLTTADESHVSGRSYDRLGQVVSTREPAATGVAVTRYDYDPWGNLIATTTPAATNTVNATHGQLTQRRQWSPWGELLSTEIVDQDGAPLAPPTVNYYDALGRLTATVAAPAVTGGVPVSTLYAYDASGQPSRVLKLAADWDRQLVANGAPLSEGLLDGLFGSNIHDRLATMVVNVHDGLGRLVRTYDAENAGLVTRFSYDVLGNVVRESATALVDGAYETQTTVRQFDALSRLTRQVGPSAEADAGAEVVYRYSPTGLMAVEQSNDPGDETASAVVTTYDYDSHGRIAGTRVSGSLPAVVEHDDWGRQVHLVGQGVGDVTRLYDGLDRLVKETGDAGVAVTRYTANGLVAEQVDHAGVTTRFQYDLFGNVLQKVVDDSSGSSTTRYRYDALGRLAEVEDPLGAVTQYRYDNHGRLIGESNGVREVRYEFDPWGRPTAELHPDHVKRWSYDQAGRMERESWWTAGENPVLLYSANFEYTPQGELSRAFDTQYGQASSTIHSEYRFEYDEGTRLLDAAYASWNGAPQPVKINYDYDRAGNLASLSAGQGAAAWMRTQYAYDNRGRLQEMTQSGDVVSDKRLKIDYLDAPSLDSLAHGEQWSLFESSYQPVVRTDLGRLPDGRVSHVRHISSDSQNISSLDLTYNDLGRLVSETRTIEGDASDYERQYEYDDRGQLIQPESRFDAAGNRLGLLNGAKQLVEDVGSRMQYDERGNVIEQIRYTPIATAAPNPGQAEAYRFGSQTLLQGTYRIWANEVVAAGDAVGVVLLDDAGVVAAARVEEGSPLHMEFSVSRNEDFENLRLRFENADGTPVAGARLSEVILQRAQRFQYEYDLRDRLIQVQQYDLGTEQSIIAATRWEYDVLGNVMRTMRDDLADGSLESDRRFVYASGRVVMELDGDGRPQVSRWETPGGRLVAVEEIDVDSGAEDGAGGRVIWTLPDHVGTIRDLVASGSVSHLRYDVYGRPLENIDQVPHEAWNRVTTRFAGFEYDSTHEIYVANGRVYEPVSGRYLSPESGQPGENGYLFAGNAPVNPENLVRSGVAHTGFGWRDTLSSFAANWAYYSHPFHNPHGSYRQLAAGVKLAGWSMYAIGSLGGGVAATVARQASGVAIRAAIGPYLAQQAAFTLAETSVEYALSDTAKYPWASRLGTYFVLNTVSGTMSGNGPWLNQLAGFLGRQTLETAVRTGVDVSRGGELISSVAKNTVAGVGGETVARGVLGAIASMRKLPAVWSVRNRRYELIVSRVPGEIRGHHTAMSPGPLRPDIAATFSGARYAEIELSEPLHLYRVWDPQGSAREVGGYWSLDPNLGTSAIIDLALFPAANRAVRLTSIEVPMGTVLYVGEVGAQRAAMVGGGSQVVLGQRVDPAWIVPPLVRRRDMSYRNLGSDF
ncbi:MAG: hypothetical protein KDB14_18055 [Planctomycetales bacterium]|nr:hypothetical protein [Planctomycetales bacterium]